MMKTISLLLGLTLATLLVVAGCGGGDPEDRTFELEIQGQALVQGDDVLKVKQNDVVIIVVAADTHISFHLHGYDIEQEAEPGEPTTLLFTANATGSFPFTMHLKIEDREEEGVHDEEPEGEHEEGEEDDIELGRLVVEPR